MGYIGIGGSRIVIWLLAYHFGMSVWLFPKYRDSWKPTKFMWPIYSAEKRGDFSDPKAIVFKIMSASLVIYSCWAFA